MWLRKAGLSQSGWDLEEHRVLVLLNNNLSLHQCEVVSPSGVAKGWAATLAEKTGECASAGVEVDVCGNCPRFVLGETEVTLVVAQVGVVRREEVDSLTLWTIEHLARAQDLSTSRRPAERI